MGEISALNTGGVSSTFPISRVTVFGELTLPLASVAVISKLYSGIAS